MAVRLALDVSAVPARPAGAGRYVVELATRVANADVQPTLLAQRGDAARWHEWASQAEVLDLVPSARPARLAYEALALGRSSKIHADVWHGPHYTMPHRRKMPTVVTICDLTFFTNPEWHEKSKVLFFQRAIQYAARHADALISISETTTKLLHQIVSPTAPVTTIPLGVNLERFAPTETPGVSLESFGLPTNVPYFFFLGTFEPRKGLDVLLEAFALAAEQDSDVELWLAGQAGWGTDGVASTIAQHPFASRIRRLGYVDDAAVPVLMRHSVAVCYPSRGEGFGLPVLEALACGSQVITTAETVMEEVAGGAATLVPIGDAPALAKALVDATKRSAAERSTNAVAAHARASQFTWDATVDGHRALYASLLARP
jgi:glycosyltransferase involved in cell wall biosynthesis